jgi:hypothetical protein
VTPFRAAAVCMRLDHEEAHESAQSVRRFVPAQGTDAASESAPNFSRTENNPRAENKQSVLRVYSPIGAEPSKEN